MGASGDYQRVRIAPDGRQVVFDRAIETVSFGGDSIASGPGPRTPSIDRDPVLAGVRRLAVDLGFLPRASAALGGRSTVGHVALDHVIGVRIPASQPRKPNDSNSR